MDIENAVCVVTGAGRGIGAALAARLVSRGATVYAADVDTAGCPAETHLVTSDVSSEEAVKALFERVAAEQGRLDILVNNAGIIHDGLLAKVKDGHIRTMPLAQFRQVIDVNLVGTFLCAREAAVLMIKGNGGVIVNISSVSRSGNFGQTNYSASKAGVDAMTVTWSKELARYSIRVAAVAPGYINTEMVSTMPDEALGKITRQVPLGRLGEMDEIGDAVEFIIGNDFVTGKVLEIDGGLRI